MAVDEAIWLPLAAGAAIPLGGLLAHRVRRAGHRVPEDVLRGIVSFGGGALLAAVALVLVPEGVRDVGPAAALAAFFTGAMAALWGVHFLKQKGTATAQYTAMMIDFLPESVALGAAVASGSTAAYLLALLIGMQNLPEAFNAYRELCHRAKRPLGARPVLWLLAGSALLGPLAGAVGLVLQEQRAVVGVIVLAASGGILALVFQDIAPQAHRRGHAAPTTGAVAGFALGLAGHMWLA